MYIKKKIYPQIEILELSFLFFFFLIFIFVFIKNNEFDFWFFFISLVFLLLGLLNSKILLPLNIFWVNIGILLGLIISPIVMGFIFFLVVFPISVLLKIFKKDILNLKYNKKPSYWIEKENYHLSMKDQF